MAHEVMCRICKKRFDIDAEGGVVENKQSYYHKDCYREWRKGISDANADMDANSWYEALVDYLYRDIKMSVNFQKLVSQWNNFTKPGKNMTPKGIYFAMRYFYEVQKGDVEKAQGGIGIVPSIYSKSAEYWQNLETKRRGTIDAIVEQIRNRETRPIQTITRKEQTKKDKSKWSLDDI